MTQLPTPRRRTTTTPPVKGFARDSGEDDWDTYPDEPADQPLPRRERRRFFNRRSAALFAALACAVGFYAGVRVEKGQLASSASTVTLPATASGRAAAGTASGASRAGGSGLASLFSGAGRSGGFAGFAGGGNASIGTVASVDGTTLYLTETSGNTVKVKLASSTKVSKTQPVPHTAIRPGDSLVVTGVTGSDGTVTAASVTDSGAGRSSGSSSGSAGGSSASGSGSSVGSLFSSGG